MEPRADGETHLLHVVPRPNVHDDMLMIAQLPRNVQRVRQRHKDRLVCTRKVSSMEGKSGEEEWTQRTLVFWLHLPDVVDARAELRLRLAELRVRVREVGELLRVDGIERLVIGRRVRAGCEMRCGG